MGNTHQTVTRRIFVGSAVFAFIIAFGNACPTVFAKDTIQAREKPAMKLRSPLKIYHIEGRRSERIVWLCEELGIPYELVFKQGDLAGSMDLIRSVNPMVPMAPTVDIDGQIIVESGGILEIIDNRYGGGRLVPAPASEDYVPYFQWLHFAEGTAMARMLTQMQIKAALAAVGQPPPPPRPHGVDGEAVLKYMDAFLGQHPYFGGAEFSLADIMMHFPAKWSVVMIGIDSNSYPNIAAWRARVEARPAFKRMMAAAEPNGVPGDPTPKGK